MPEIIHRSKALSVSPVKVSQPVGASLAFLGINRAISMLHGSQGCTAFAKVFFVRHFREPIPLQTTAMDQTSSVLGADENIVEGLKILCQKSKPDMIGLPTTGLSETQGADVYRVVREFCAANPQFAGIAIIPVVTPDYSGCLESGFALAVHSMINELVRDAGHAGTQPGSHQNQVNVLAGSALTPGDIEAIKDMIIAFGLRPVVVPDISESLDGHLHEDAFSPLTTGGTSVSDITTMGNAQATLVIGASLNHAADLLHARTGVSDFRFNHLMGLDASDSFVMALTQISQNPIPEKIARQRAQLQDAMLDSHFMIGQARVAMAADPDLLCAFTDLLMSMGAEMVSAVASARAPVLKQIPASTIKIGDLQDLECAAAENKAELFIGNSHLAESAKRLNLPLLRVGFPLYDLLGGYQRNWIGYKGTRQTLFDLANIFLEHNHHEISPYRSVYAQPNDSV